MTNCQDRFQELTDRTELILMEDLEALKRKADHARIEDYNQIKSDEKELEGDFRRECRDFLSTEEFKEARREFRLARLLIASSFYAEGDMPQALQGDFLESELQAVVDFDRYKQFDNADEERIEWRIRQMDGEMHELVEEYMTSQNTNLVDLMDNPKVQKDITDALADRYEDRRKNIEHGVFAYIEAHGIPNMIESIEDAVKEVSDATQEREQIREVFQEELTDIESTLERGFQQQRNRIERDLTDVERRLASETLDEDELRQEIQRIDTIDESVLSELESSIDRTHELEHSLDEKIAKLEEVKQEAAEARDEDSQQAAAIVESELERLEEQRSELKGEIESLQLTRQEIEEASSRLDERQQTLEERVEAVETSVDSEGGIEGADVVTSSTARLFEMDYIGRFDTTMYEVDSIETPDGPFSVPDNYWDDRGERRNERPRMSRLLDENDGGAVESSPINPTARYEITANKYLGLRQPTKMVIEATVFSHLESHAINGFDGVPASLEDLLSFVNDAVKEAHQEDVPYILGIASPTGWTDRVIDQVVKNEISRTRYSRHVSICLIDLRSGELHYDESDTLMADNIALFERSVIAESAQECAKEIRAEYVSKIGRETVFADAVVDEMDYRKHEVKQAFNRLETNGEGEQFYVDSEGLALDVS